MGKVKKDNPDIGGTGKLKTKLIDELTVHYGLAIRRNTSVGTTKKVIWVTSYHKIFTEEKPQHDKCQSGELWILIIIQILFL